MDELEKTECRNATHQRAEVHPTATNDREEADFDQNQQKDFQNEEADAQQTVQPEEEEELNNEQWNG